MLDPAKDPDLDDVASLEVTAKRLCEQIELVAQDDHDDRADRIQASAYTIWRLSDFPAAIFWLRAQKLAKETLGYALNRDLDIATSSHFARGPFL